MACFGVLEQGLIYAVLALGVYIIIQNPRFSGYDGGFILPLGAAVTALMISNGVNPLLTLPPRFWRVRRRARSLA